MSRIGTVAKNLDAGRNLRDKSSPDAENSIIKNAMGTASERGGRQSTRTKDLIIKEPTMSHSGSGDTLAAHDSIAAFG